MYFSVYTSDIGTKYEIYGVTWQVAPESKIQFISCEISPKYLLGIFMLEDIRAIDTYISVTCFFLYSCPIIYIFFVDLYAQVFFFNSFQWNIFSEFYGFREYVIQWSSYPHPNNVFGFQFLRSVRLFLGLHELKDELNLLFIFSFICWFFSFLCDPTHRLHLEWPTFALYLALTEF